MPSKTRSKRMKDQMRHVTNPEPKRKQYLNWLLKMHMIKIRNQRKWPLKMLTISGTKGSVY